MGQPAVVSGDRITGNCPVHQVPSPSGTAPIAGLPFSSALLQGLAPSVLINNRPAAVQGSSGLNTPPHAGLHPSDPAITPTNQKGQVVVGSSTVMFERKPAAYTGCTVTHCTPPVPGQVTGSAQSVRIGP